MEAPPRAANRLFVAADLPPAARERLAAVGAHVAAHIGGRAVPPASLHATLAFLGAVPPAAVAGLVAALARRVRAAVEQALGRPGEEGRFWPHVTLVRLRPPARAAALPPVDREHLFDISRAALYDSVQSPGGPPTYRELAAVELSPAP